MFAREKAEMIAQDFLDKMNPTNWNGKGRKPKRFDQRIVTYNIDSKNGNVLDISFEKLDDEESCVAGWTHCCELIDKETDCLIEMLHGYGINSLENLTDSIMDLCREEN